MGFNKIVAVSMTELFVQQIENMILSGELAIGEQLPPARELSVKMGVSRTVISAGLAELEKLGFVEIRTRPSLKSSARSLTASVTHATPTRPQSGYSASTMSLR